MPFYIYIQCKCVLSYRHIYIYIHHTYIYSINADGFIRIGQDESEPFSEPKPCDPAASLREGRMS